MQFVLALTNEYPAGNRDILLLHQGAGFQIAYCGFACISLARLNVLWFNTKYKSERKSLEYE